MVLFSFTMNAYINNITIKCNNNSTFRAHAAYAIGNYVNPSKDMYQPLRMQSQPKHNNKVHPFTPLRCTICK